LVYHFVNGWNKEKAKDKLRVHLSKPMGIVVNFISGGWLSKRVPTNLEVGYPEIIKTQFPIESLIVDLENKDKHKQEDSDSSAKIGKKDPISISTRFFIELRSHLNTKIYLEGNRLGT
jgi:hypothetical protein